ncbi:hypothetical protein [Nocardiopsis coralliicola]
MRGTPFAIAAVPAAALLAVPLLPFLRTADLWFGLPPMLVWTFVWCVLVTPALLLAERIIEAGGDPGSGAAQGGEDR